MKVRNGFVSNSSSSSYIVFGRNLDNILPPSCEGEKFVIGKEGKAEFGWEVEKTSDCYGKINFAWMQTIYANREDWGDLVVKALKEHTKCSEVSSGLSLDYWGHGEDEEEYTRGYIDHQSAASEGENTEMFESYESLVNFLFDPNSYIQGGNDNMCGCNDPNCCWC